MDLHNATPPLPLWEERRLRWGAALAAGGGALRSRLAKGRGRAGSVSRNYRAQAGWNSHKERESLHRLQKSH